MTQDICGYRLERLIGRGSFGEVWQASKGTEGPCAVKLLPLNSNTWQEVRGAIQFRGLRHPNIMEQTACFFLDERGRELPYGSMAKLAYDDRGLDFLPEGKRMAVVMPLADFDMSKAGETYRGNDPQFLDWMEQAARGIDFLNGPIHDFGNGPESIIHRDIKPSNMLLCDGCLKISDFGTTQRRGINEATRKREVAGSRAYMAPEVLSGIAGLSSDQYSLAISIIELRTGSPPSPGEKAGAPMDTNRGLDVDLTGLSLFEAFVIRKALAPDPNDRFSSCLEMIRSLDNAVDVGTLSDSKAGEVTRCGLQRFTYSSSANKRSESTAADDRGGEIVSWRHSSGEATTAADAASGTLRLDRSPFELRNTFISKTARSALSTSEINCALTRHSNGEFGQLYDYRVAWPSRDGFEFPFSQVQLPSGLECWVITTPNRRATLVVLPFEGRSV